MGLTLGTPLLHSWRNLPILLAGGGYKHGHHVAHNSENNTPLANLFVPLAQRMGLDINSFGSSTHSDFADCKYDLFQFGKNEISQPITITMNRRTLLQASLASTLSIPAFALEKSNPFRKNIGIQLYTLRNQIKADVKGTLAAVAKAGYKQVEAYGFDGKASDMMLAAKDNGMAVNFTHFAWESVTNPTKKGVPSFESILEGAKDVGLTHLVIPCLHAQQRKDLDGYKRVAELCNKAAQKPKQPVSSLPTTITHSSSSRMGGEKSGFDVFKSEFSKDMHFEVDVFWVKVGGVSPVKLIRDLKDGSLSYTLRISRRAQNYPTLVAYPTMRSRN